ncbi:MAG: homoserine dehydrogenase [Lachnospiraceae bacterium]|nr:homoserine dehydrogenase [Lachnospiraceae bacterium]
MAKIAILGYGTVGSGVAEVIDTNRSLIEKRIKDTLEVKYILDLREFPGDPNEDKVVHDVNVILEDPEISIICETMGGNEPAYTFSKKALQAGKSVCTSNKELVANHGAELIALAEKNKCNYLFEASVGGGIPIIRPMNSALTAERVVEISGILNGTTNYILTKMEREGARFEDALKEAQDKGYAERNPEADVEGYDACRKIAILSSLMSGKTVDFKQIYTEGITAVTPADFSYAAKLNMTIKLLAMAKEKEDGYLAAVAPYMITKENPLAGVNDVFNAVFVKGNTLGDSMYYGRGAGKLPTASAVVGDVVECARNFGEHLPCLWEEENVSLKDFSSAKGRFFVRVNKVDEAKANELFGSVEKIYLENYPEEFGFMSGEMTEAEFEQKKAQLSGFVSRIRLKD